MRSPVYFHKLVYELVWFLKKKLSPLSLTLHIVVDSISEKKIKKSKISHLSILFKKITFFFLVILRTDFTQMDVQKTVVHHAYGLINDGKHYLGVGAEASVKWFINRVTLLHCKSCTLSANTPDRLPSIGLISCRLKRSGDRLDITGINLRSERFTRR